MIFAEYTKLRSGDAMRQDSEYDEAQDPKKALTSASEQVIASIRVMGEESRPECRT